MIVYDIEERYNNYCNVTQGWGIDMTEHMPTLRRYASECEHITEMGVRYVVSTWAFLAAKPKKLISYDIAPPSRFDASIEIQDITEAARLSGTEFVFILDNTLSVTIEETDLLFIDTLHNYSQLKYELQYHGNKARKYIIMHDTHTYGRVGEMLDPKGLLHAIEEFLAVNPHWKTKEVFENCNGLTVLERVQG
jgi:hypothetical protein